MDDDHLSRWAATKTLRSAVLLAATHGVAALASWVVVIVGHGAGDWVNYIAAVMFSLCCLGYLNSARVLRHHPGESRPGERPN